MKNKKVLLIISTLCLSALVVCSVLTNKVLFSATAEDTSYTLNMNNTKNRFHTKSEEDSGKSKIKTELGSEIEFTYHYVKNGDNNWHTLSKDSDFYNVNPIHGLKSITINCNTEETSYKIYYSTTRSFSETLCESFTTSTTYNFNDDSYNYFRVLNTSGVDLDIASIVLTYSCINTALSYTLTLNSSDTSKGTVNGAGKYQAGTQVTVSLNYIKGIFEGWSNTTSGLVSTDRTYTFTMPNNDYVLTALFMTDEEEQNVKNGISPFVDKATNTLTYGLYPQTVVSDDNLITTLNGLGSSYIDYRNGYYLYNNEYYTKVIADPYSKKYKFNNGNSIAADTPYWFKCEAIVWDILTSNNGKYYLLCDVLLDNHWLYVTRNSREFGETTLYSSNYMYSDIRAWLNGYDGSSYEANNYTGSGFIDTAFALNSTYIETTFVDNSINTTTIHPDDGTNPYVCDNTNDKLFLLSYKDYLNSNYGFSTTKDASKTRECKTTDFARAVGAYNETDEDYLNNGIYYSRSPQYIGGATTLAIGSDGYMDDLFVDDMSYCIRPAITLQIS